MFSPEPLGFRQSTPLPNSRAKFVDARLGHRGSDVQAETVGRYTWCRPPSRQQLLDNLPFLGSREARERWWDEIHVSEDIRGRRIADDLNNLIDTARRVANREQFEAALSAEEKRRIQNGDVSLDRLILEKDIEAEIEEIGAEHAGRHKNVASLLPEEFATFLKRLHPAKRGQREEAMRDYVGIEDLSLIKLDPLTLSASAEVRAKQYFRKYPPRDADGNTINQDIAHRKRRCEKWWRRNLRKRQRRALLYVEAAVGAVGGPNVSGRPLYVSDYSPENYKEQLSTTNEILENLRLVCVSDPAIQIPMKELNARKKHADAAKRRLLVDAILARIEGLNMHLCWITITLPGRFVPHATNEVSRAAEWDPSLGPDEALNAIQDMHHDVMCLLRERGIRPIGWWNAQSQQSGTPHRHLLLACPTREDARAVCDAFWDKFASTNKDSRQAEARQSDPGCRAYVVGDFDPVYAPPEGKNGQEETASSIAKYMARYASRYVDPDLSSEKDDESLRHAAWASSRRVRTHTFVGLDAGRSPSALWDTLWSKAARDGECSDPEDPRMRLAIKMMRQVQENIDAISALRKHQNTLENEDLEHQKDLIKAESSKAAHLAWHAGIAIGLWPDRDLAPEEQEWLQEELKETVPEHRNPGGQITGPSFGESYSCSELTDPVLHLPPMPLRDVRESSYGERRSVTIGAVAPVPQFVLPEEQNWTIGTLNRIYNFLKIDRNNIPSGTSGVRSEIRKALKGTGVQITKRSDGTCIAFDLTGEEVLRTEKEWIITDVDTASEMVIEWEKNLKRKIRLDDLSDNPTDPRVCPPDISGSCLSGEPPPS